MLAVIIKGNPKFINTPLAKDYYKQIETFLKNLGFKVEFDAGADYTRPRQDADLYIGHSRGAGRYEFMTAKAKKKFLRFGDIDGIIHPVDKEWQLKNPPPTDATPPDEHFEFDDVQQEAIRDMIAGDYSSESKVPAELQDLFNKALKDPFLGPAALKLHLENITPLYFEGKVVGFSVPFQEPDGYWRTGSIYVLPEYRGKGVAADFIRAFRQGKRMRAWIEPKNASSIRAYKAAGFLPTAKRAYAGAKPFDEYTVEARDSERMSKMLDW